MIIATSSLPWETFTPESLERRMTVLKEALQKCRNKRVSLLCLPAGYFKIQHDAERAKLGRRVAALARVANIAVAVGVDVGSKGKKSRNAKEKKRRSCALTRRQLRPEWTLIANPCESRTCFLRQRSVSRCDQHLVPDDVCASPKTVLVAGKRVEILGCGEIFNSRIRESILTTRPKVDVVVDIGHKSAEYRVDGPLKVFAEGGLWSFCSTHAKTLRAMKRAYAPGGRKMSSREIDIAVEGPPQLELKLWNL